MLVTRKREGLDDVVVDDLVADKSDAASAFAFEEAIDGVASHTGGKDAVERTWGAASLDVAKDVDAGIESSGFLETFSESVDIREEFLGDDDDCTFVRVIFSHLS